MYMQDKQYHVGYSGWLLRGSTLNKLLSTAFIFFVFGIDPLYSASSGMASSPSSPPSTLATAYENLPVDKTANDGQVDGAQT